VLSGGSDGEAVAARVIVPQEIAWRIFTKGIDPSAAGRLTTIAGDERLGRGVLSLLAIVA
jgi:hypothetical protein